MEIDTLGNLWINTFTKGVTVYKNGGVVGFDCIDMSLQSGGITATSEIIETNNNLTVYPNPSNKLISVSFEMMTFSPVQIEIIDMTGSILKRINIPSMNPCKQIINIDIDKLSAGLYLCHVKKNDGVLTTKIVKSE
ncbi:MAG: T9SS type A sorting domain-containing protein [Bacteroidetes bacterium]|nr:T9SS type A sorting domain-containing protein [Bacteroidota bacterium]